MIPLPEAIRDALKEPSIARYLKVILDLDDQNFELYPVNFSCTAAGEYQKWHISMKNRGAFEEGMFAGYSAAIECSIDGLSFYRIWTGYVSDDGCKRTVGLRTNDQVSLELVDPTSRKGTKRKPSDVLMVNCMISNPSNPASSIIHILAAKMGITSLDTVKIPYTLPVVQIGSKTIWKELQLLAEAYHADCYFDHLGRLRFRSPLEENFQEPVSEWLFQGNPTVAISGNASRIIGPVEISYRAVTCNRAKSTIAVFEELSERIIYKNTDNYNQELDQCLIELQPGAYWPGPAAADKAQLKYKDPSTGEAYPYASSVQVPSLSNGSSTAEIVYEGGALTLVSCNGSNAYTRQLPTCSEIILQNTGASVCRIRKLTIRGVPYRQTKEQEVEFSDPVVTDEVLYVDEEIEGKYAASPDQINQVLSLKVTEGKDRVRQFSFATSFLPQLQRKARIVVQLPGKDPVPCVIDTYDHSLQGKTLAGMITHLVCTETTEFIPAGTPFVVMKETPAGIDSARSFYNWIRYADDANGSGMSENPAGKPYLGIAYNKESSIPSEDPAEYTWSLYEGPQGEPAVQLQILSTNGDIFRPALTDTTLEAHIFQSGQDITDQYLPSRFRWSRTSGDTQSDAVWNSAHYSTGGRVFR